MSAQTTKKPRDLRIDFFRGISMFIILIAHTPGNFWGRYIPARWGPSDAADVFVFCSGYASAIAFGAVFMHRSFLLGTARIMYRFWQIYWAQICLFLATAAVCVLGTELLDARDYVRWLNLYRFFDEPMQGLVGLLTLTYVPNFFDILPMYMIALLLIPVVMLLRIKVNLYAVILFCLTLWVVARFGINLPAEWWTNDEGERRQWFFNPFAWQLIFFTGFAFGAGWFLSPAPKRWLILICLAYVIIMIPLSRWQVAREFELIQMFRDLTWDWGFTKTNYGLFRFLHVLALAYLMRCLLFGREQILEHPWLSPIITVGQNALPVFMSSIVLAAILGMANDLGGRETPVVVLTNLVGFAALIAVAMIAAFFKSQPWRRRPDPRPTSEPERPTPAEDGRFGFEPAMRTASETR